MQLPQLIQQLLMLTQRHNNKVNQLDNFDYETMTMGNYRLKNNIETDALDIEYLGGS